MLIDFGYLHAYLHAYLHTYLHAYLHACLQFRLVGALSRRHLGSCFPYTPHTGNCTLHIQYRTSESPAAIAPTLTQHEIEVHGIIMFC